jgi:copper ion binding protein
LTAAQSFCYGLAVHTPSPYYTELSMTEMTPAAETRDYTVRGMTCDHCAGSVTAEITKIPGVTGVQVDVAAGRVTVESAQPVSADAVSEAVEEAGYEVVAA